MTPPAFWIALWLLGNALAVGVFDVVAYFFLPPNETVSYWCQQWMREFPILGVLVGVVIGHLAWPTMRIPTDKPLP